MKTLYVGVSSWIIQDGNYPDFKIGDRTKFALEFYPHSLSLSNKRETSAEYLKESIYKVCGKVVYRTKEAWVIDVGFLLFQETTSPKFAVKDSWIEGEIYIGIDPFFYFEYLKNRPNMPSLTYEFLIEHIMLETTPWIEGDDKIIKRDETKKSFRDVAETDAWNDDNGHAYYILKCVRLDLKE